MITVEELKKRGFTRIPQSKMVLRFKNAHEIRISVYDFYVELYCLNDSMNVPNCKTIEDLDNLIKLFS